jgi:hypothetical protein
LIAKVAGKWPRHEEKLMLTEELTRELAALPQGGVRLLGTSRFPGGLTAEPFAQRGRS